MSSLHRFHLYNCMRMVVAANPTVHCFLVVGTLLGTFDECVRQELQGLPARSRFIFT